MTPQEIAAGVAADIRKYGHAKSTLEAGAGRCCLLVSPTTKPLLGRDYLRYQRELKARIGVDDVVPWNDTHPAAEVLAVLDSLAGTAPLSPSLTVLEETT